MKGLADVELSEDLCCANTCQCLVNEWQWVLVLPGHVVQLLEVNTKV